MKKELTCRIDAEREAVYMARGNTQVGHISRGADGEPEFVLKASPAHTVYISFNDIEVAMDNWNQMQDFRAGADSIKA